MRIRPYGTQDYDQLVALYKDKRAYGGHFDATRDTKERLQATAEQGNLYVAVQDDTVVATAMILDNPHSFWLLRFAVDPTCKDEPLVTRLLFNKMLAIGHERGHGSVIIYTDSEDKNLQQRYEALGCKKADTYRCYWKETAV